MNIFHDLICINKTESSTHGALSAPSGSVTKVGTHKVHSTRLVGYLDFWLFSSLSIQIDTIQGLLVEGYSSWSKNAEKGTSEIEPARPLPSIGLSHLAVWKIFDHCFCFNTDLYGKSQTKPWNTPARLVSFPTVCYVYKTSAYSKRCETNS